MNPTNQELKKDLEIIASKLKIDPNQLKFGVYKSASGKYSEWEFRRSFNSFSSAIKDLFGEPEKDLVSIKGSQVRIKEVNKLKAQLGDQLYWNERWRTGLSDALKENPIILHEPRKFAKPKASKSNRYVIAHLSDNHWGAFIDSREVEGNEYTWEIAARRTGMFVDEIANYKLDHRDECEGLVLNIGGDQIEGVLYHNQEWFNIDMLTWQMVGATRYIISTIDYLLNFYPTIIVPVTTDNHGRVQTAVKGKDRAKRQRYDSMITQMMETVRQVFRNEPRVKIVQPLTPFTMYKLFDWNVLLVHGDAVINFGNPFQAVPMASIAAQIDSFNAARSEGDKAHVVFGGHVHFGLHAWLENGVRLFINPSMSGAGPYSNFLGAMRSSIGQWLVEVTKENRVGDMRLVDLSSADKNKEFEKIIPPFKYTLES